MYKRQICGNPRRDNSIICVVEDVKDIIAMEKTHEYKGVISFEQLQLNYKLDEAIEKAYNIGSCLLYTSRCV